MRWLVAFVFTLSLFVFPVDAAFSATVYLVQLGSFKSDVAADKQWKTLKSANKKLLGELFHQNSELRLPPANNTIYRLQAGPFPTREDAASACNAMQQDGQDCVIVESAGFAPKESPPVAVAKSEPMKPVEKVLMPGELSPLAEVKEKAAVKKAAKAAIVAEKKAEKIEEKKVATAEPSLLDQFKSAFSGEKTPEKKQPEAVVALKKPEKALLPVNLPVKKIKKPKKKLPARLATVKTLQAPEKKKEEKVVLPWLNTPVDAPKEVAKKQAQPPAVRPEAPESEPRLVVEEMPQTLPFGRVGDPYIPVSAPSAKRLAMLPPPKDTGVVPMPQEHDSAEPEAVKVVYKETRPKGQITISEAARLAAQQESGQGSEVAEAAEADAAVSDKDMSRDRLAPGDSHVEVAEAIQVPLSEKPVKKVAVVEPKRKTGMLKPPVLRDAEGKEIKLSGVPGAGLKATPSRNQLMHSYWLDIQYFKNERAALGYLQTLRKRAPSATKSLRVRVTRPFLKDSSATRSASLQLGPLAEMADAKALCALVTSDELSCYPRKDTGISTAAGQSRQRADTSVMRRREVVALRSAGGEQSQYWVQLGSYHNSGDASELWDSLKAEHAALKSYQPYVVQPALSSSAEPVHRLRTGPFQLRGSAQALCDTLREEGTQCLVIAD